MRTPSERSMAGSSTSPQEPLLGISATPPATRESARRPSVCTSGSSSTPKRSSTRRRPSAISASDRRCVASAGVLDEVRVLGGEAGAPHGQPLQPASASRSPRCGQPRGDRSGFLKVEPKVLMPCGWASWRRARISARRRLDASGSARLERQDRRARRSRRREVRAPVGEPELVGLASLGAGGGRRSRPIEHPSELAPVGVRVHPHGSADAAGDVHPELDPRQAGTRGEGGDRGQPRATAADDPLARRARSARARGRASATSPGTPSSATSRFDPEPTTATGSARVVRPSAAAPTSCRLIARAREVLSRAARADGRQARQRLLPQHARGRASEGGGRLIAASEQAARRAHRYPRRPSARRGHRSPSSPRSTRLGLRAVAAASRPARPAAASAAA